MSASSNAYKPWFRIQFIDHIDGKHFINDQKDLKDPMKVREVVGDDQRDLNVIGAIHPAAPQADLIVSRRNGVWLDRTGKEFVWVES